MSRTLDKVLEYRRLRQIAIDMNKLRLAKYWEQKERVAILINKKHETYENECRKNKLYKESS